MVFDLDTFAKDPNAQYLAMCTKKDLPSVADRYGIGVKGNLRIEELQTKIIKALVEQGILEEDLELSIKLSALRGVNCWRKLHC